MTLINSVLVMDDDQEMLALYKAWLQKIAKKVTCIESGVQGLSKMSTETFDLIVCDYKMPTKDGDEIVSIIRRIVKGGAYVPIVMASGHMPLEVEKKLLEEENFLILRKPLKKNSFLGAINEFLTLIIIC